jgi:uncharacterized membrane protein YccC
MSRSARWASQGIWRSVIAISIAVAVQSGVLLNDSTAEPWPVVAGRILGAILAFGLIFVGLDWATRGADNSLHA